MFQIQIEVPMFSQILVTIGQLVNKLQQFFEIQYGGGRHLELCLRRLFEIPDVFVIKVAILLLNLVMFGRIVKKWQPFYEIQDGGDRYLEI